MRQIGSEHLTNDELMANAMELAVRWERVLATGGGHKLSDRPDRSSKHKSHGGPDRPYGRMDESKTRSYEYSEAHGDMLTVAIRGHERMVSDRESMPANWYGDDYGTGRHYSHIADQIFVEPSHGGMGQTARTGAALKMVLTPFGQFEYRYNVVPNDPKWGQIIVRYDRPSRSTRKVKVIDYKPRGKSYKAILAAEKVDYTGVFASSDGGYVVNQKVDR